MQESLYQTADAGKLYQTADAEVSLSDSGCRGHSNSQRMQKHSISQWMQESFYQTADAGDTLIESR